MTSAEGIYEELTDEECRQLLESHEMGRLGVVVNGAPLIFPVNYVFHEGSVVFRTSAGTKLAGSVLGRVVFEIDGVDEDRRSGWSVIVHGIGAEIGEALDRRSERLRALELQPWAPGDRSHWVAVQADTVSGRRLSRG